MILNILLTSLFLSSNIIYKSSSDNGTGPIIDVLGPTSETLSPDKAIIAEEQRAHGEYHFASKKDLFYAFYRDFYNYILSVDGGSYLEYYNIHSLNDYLYAHTIYTDTAKGLEYVYILDGPYFLTKKPGGNMLEQIDKPGFIGYCVKNNMYIELIAFLEKFFYYWRLDEGYTDFNDPVKKTGSDFYYMPADSAVDTAKFFYFDKHTIPGFISARGHIPEMYDNIPYLK